MAKDKFIKFLKKKKIFNEFKTEVNHNFKYDFPHDYIESEGVEHILEDGNFLYYNETITGVDWGLIDKEWKGELSECNN